MHDNRIKVAINATALLSPRTGIGQYVYSLGKELNDLGRVLPRYFYGYHWGDALREEPVANIAKAKASIRKYLPGAYVISRTITQARFTSGLLRRPVDLYHDPNYLAYRFRGPTVITVHDLSWIRHPETHPKDRLNAMSRYFPRSLEQAVAIVTDCEFVKRELVEVFGVDPSRVRAVALGVSPAFRPHSALACSDVLARHGLDYGRYFLSVGTLEPRKNIPTLVDAFSRLPAEVQARCPLVMVGMRGWLTSSIEKKMRPLVDKGLIKLLGYIADEQMPMLYSAAAAFVFPSLYEGFGLPPLEAMACGVPVIVSNSSSLPEVVGDAGVSVEPMDVDSISEAMRRVQQDRQFADELSGRGIARALDFTWRRTAEETTAVYLNALAR
jgi:glycosyltransferase involved in cell wall biosynthesis